MSDKKDMANPKSGIRPADGYGPCMAMASVATIILPPPPIIDHHHSPSTVAQKESEGKMQAGKRIKDLLPLSGYHLSVVKG